ncbi:MAG: glutamate--tRNA ligase [Bacteroidales bacterium]|nr:glutamate--tRNA ligase [Bacteroidales bacterium]
MSEREIRVRFAPSPTGPLHIGGVRTALFNYLFARKNNGKFILRIEDTDQNRYVEGAVDYILESLEWCGIHFDEGVHKGGPFAPYRQSERKNIYRQYADTLIENGFAYYAFDTPDELENLRKELERNQVPNTSYSYHCRNRMSNSLSLSRGEVQQELASGTPFVIRFKMPENVEIAFSDIVRGDISVNTSTLDDKVLFKSDGMPTYHLANVVDDHLMEISHVIRGEEWLPSLPLHVMLYRAFGWDESMPLFAHMPLTLKPDGKGKLSKRDGDRLGFPVFPLEWKNPQTGEVSGGYRESGYFPEAFINILALLGWNPGTEQELFTMDELIEIFSLDRIIKSGSRFDPAKARWFNHQYLMKKNDDELAAMFSADLEKRGVRADPDTVRKVAGLVKERADFVKDFWQHSCFFFQRPENYDAEMVKKQWKQETPQLLLEFAQKIKAVDGFDKDKTELLVKAFLEEKQTGTGKLMNPLRLALVGSPMGPGMFDIMEILGREEVVARIENALDKIKI